MTRPNRTKNTPVCVVIPPQMHQQMKVAAAMQNKEISQIYTEAVRKYLEENKRDYSEHIN